MYSDYQCIAKRQKRTCTMKGVNRDFIENEVIKQLQDNIFSYERIDDMVEKIHEFFIAGHDENKREIVL